jgi:hypothetical protein
MQLLTAHIDTILRIIPIPGLHYLCQAIDPYAVPATILPPLEEFPLADQRSYYHCGSLGCRHHLDRLLPLRTYGEELAPTGRGNMHSHHSVLLRSANSQHHHRSFDHRRTDPGGHVAPTQQEIKDWCDHDVCLGYHHASLRHRSPCGSTGAYCSSEDDGFHL